MDSFHRIADVVVVGYGYAGATAAIVAHDLSCKVLLLEKMPRPGGMSILAGGGVKFTDDPKGTFRYLRRTCMGTTPDDVLWTFVQGMAELEQLITELAKVNGSKLRIRKNVGGTYPFEGGEGMGYMKVVEVPGFQGYPWAKASGTGDLLFKVLADNVNLRGIDVLYSTRAKELLTNGLGEVSGVLAEREGGMMRIGARKAVILSSGGFENNEAMKLQFFEAQPVYGVCTPSNTGDGIVMAQKLGASIWHMWHFHGSYGFKYDGLRLAFRHSVAGGRTDVGMKKMFWILVDKFGRRYMNEYPPAPQDTAARPMAYYDPDIQDFPRIPSYMLFDERGRASGPIAQPVSDDDSYRYDWSPDNSEEVKRGWIKSAQSVEELAFKLNLPTERLRETIERWNRQCKAGSDTDFGRPFSSLHPIEGVPFYGTEVWPVVSNTQGGLAHDAEQRVLDSFGKPIPRLYVAGELGSIFGHLYLQAGNLSECFIAGKMAAKNAASEKELW